MVFGFLRSAFGHEPDKPACVREAEACYSQEELSSIKEHFSQACQSQGGGQQVLQERVFVHALCGLPTRSGHAAPSSQWPAEHAALVGAALFHTCCGLSSRQQAASGTSSDPAATHATGAAAPAGVSLNDVMVAKAACERQPTSDSHAFAFRVLCQLAHSAQQQAAAAGDASTNAPPTHSASTAPSHAALPAGAAAASAAASAEAATQGNTAHAYEEQGLPVNALEGALAALGALLDLNGLISTPVTHASSSSPALPGNASTTGAEPKEQAPAGAEDSVGGTGTGGDAAGASSGKPTASSSADQAALHAWVASAAQGALWVAAGPACSQPAAGLTLTGYTRWVKSVPVWHTLLAGLLFRVGRPAQPGPPLPQPPSLLLANHRDGGSTADVRSAAPSAGLLLHPLAALLLASCMPVGQRAEWRLVFSSDRDGKSFNTLMGRLAGVEGATLLLVRESGEAGHLVAGYGPAPWRKSGTYFGDATSWVARLLPDMQVFPATGANTNFQWCGQGFSQLTNGIGFGGAQGSIPAYALLLDATLDSGQSRPIATFGSPALTHSQTFKVETVECWVVQPPEEEEEEGAGRRHAGTSVLDQRGTDRVIMGLAGMKVDHSAGLRDEPLEED